MNTDGQETNAFQNDNAKGSIFAANQHSKVEKVSVKELGASMRFKNALRAKFQELLQTGKALLDANASSVIVAEPVKSESVPEFQQVTAELVRETEKVALVEGLASNGKRDSHIEEQFISCVSMLNKLATELRKAQFQFNTEQSFEDSALNVSEEAKQELTSALVVHGNLSRSFHEHMEIQSRLIKHEDSFDYNAEKFLAIEKAEVKTKTFGKYLRAFAILRSLFTEGFDMNKFSRRDTLRVKELLNSMEKHQQQGKKGKLLSSKTKNGILSNYCTFFQWYIDNVNIDANNPFSRSSFRRDKSAPKRRSFTCEEVNKILSYECMHGNEATHFRNDAYWYTKIAMYSGMRLNELSALPLSRIKQEKGIWYFDLIGLELKNEASERTIPVAQYLLDEGIIKYIEKLKRQGETFLFPEIRRDRLEPGSGGWGDPISRWFNRSLLKNIGIDTAAENRARKVISFHSTRRTLISTCVNKGEEHYLIKRIVGHSVDDDITLSVYADMDEIPLYKLKEVLDRNLKWHKA